MKFTISTLLWLLLVIASFLAGFTAQSITEPVVPVLIASKNVDEETFLTPKHFLVVHRRASTLPYGVSQTQRTSTANGPSEKSGMANMYCRGISMTKSLLLALKKDIR